ncbi:MAG: SDR family oxidoreductase [Kofleriaceae bacterium]
MTTSTGRVAGKVALVTGAASGIGRGAAAALVREGATVVATDRAVEAGAAAAAAVGARFVPLDVTDAEAWPRVVAEVVAAAGRLDVLVNAAGIGRRGDIETTSLDDFRLMYRVNVEGTFLGCQAAFAAMAPTGGSIINLSSVAGLIGTPDLMGYSASKGAVRLMSKSIALHGARRQPAIRCNSVHPSFIDTPMVDAMAAAAADPVAAKGRLAQAAPLGRLGLVDEVAAMILYLASDEAAFVTGAELVIDGGLTAR